MLETVLVILKESIIGSFGIIKSLVLVIVPLMITIEIMVAYKWLEKLSLKTRFITDFLGVSKDTLIPMLIGIFAGISYGAGTILDAKERYDLSKKDIFLTLCLLVPFHGIFEISLIFWAIGVNPLIILPARLATGLSVTLLCKKLVKFKA